MFWSEDIESPFWETGKEGEVYTPYNTKKERLHDDILASGEAKLLEANFEDALWCLFQGARKRKYGDRSLVKQEIKDWEWLSSDESDYIFSFGAYCNYMGWDKNIVRKKIKTRIEEYLDGEYDPYFINNHASHRKYKKQWDNDYDYGEEYA